MNACCNVERELVCSKCNGTGYATDSSGHVEVCPECFGLGTVKTTDPPPPLSKSKRSIRKVLLSTFIGLGIYYGVFFYYYDSGMLSITDAIVILLAGHFVAISFIVLYVLFSSVYSA